ncbi:hypothetical protein TNCV_2112171 [Trichonephila clavipes]|nr:hypothetical protein TNCV_2112171 [Trichonephila clavipes]
MKNGRTTTIQAVKEGGQHPGNQSSGSVARRTLTRCFSVSSRIVVELFIQTDRQKSRQTINSSMYSNMLIKVSDAIHEKRRKFRSKMVLFHQDNVQPHVSAMTG